MLKPCRDCSYEISEQAFACPNCGSPVPGLEVRSGPGPDKAMLGVGVILSLSASYMTYVLIQAYAEMLARFGPELPYVTALLSRFYPVFVCLPALIVLGVWFIRRGKPRRGVSALVAGGATLFLFPQLASTIMSLPVFALGK